MLKRILFNALVFAVLVTNVNVGAHEPGGFNGKLYAGEVAVGTSLAMIPVGFGIFRTYATTISTAEKDEETALYVMSTYPILMGFGTFLVGEIWGTSSGNNKACYIIPTAVTLGVTAGAAFLGSSLTSDGKDGALVGEWVSIVPNAFLNAYLYNVVKEPKEENTHASISVSPYFTASRESRVGRDFTITCGIVASY